MDFGMPTLIENQTILESIKLCNALGLQFIELNMNLPQYQIEELNKSTYFNTLADQYQIYYTIHLDENVNVCDFNKTVSSAYMDTIFRTIETAKLYDIPIINMHMNHGVYFTLPDKKIYLYEQYSDIYMNNIQSLRKMCEEALLGYDIKIAIENTDGYTIYERKAIEYLLESDMFVLTWDIGHSHGITKDETFIFQHRNKLSHFHIHDAIGNKNHMTLGSGEIDIVKKLDIANQCSCRCVIETKTIEALNNSVQWLNARKDQPSIL